MAQIENGGSSTSVHAIVRQRFIDQIEADEVVIQFLEDAGLRAKESFWPVYIEWYEHDSDGRSGVLRVLGNVQASVTVTRDQHNFSEICGVSFV
jgi:hypothetical protein